MLLALRSLWEPAVVPPPIQPPAPAITTLKIPRRPYWRNRVLQARKSS